MCGYYFPLYLHSFALRLCAIHPCSVCIMLAKLAHIVWLAYALPYGLAPKNVTVSNKMPNLGGLKMVRRKVDGCKVAMSIS